MSMLNVLDVDMRCVPMFAAMQSNGILIDPSEFALLECEFTDKMDQLSSEISRMAGRTINPGSPEQVEQLLFREMELHKYSPIAKRTKASGQDGNPERWSTGSEILESIVDKHPIVQKIINWKEYQKLITSYIRVLPLMAGQDGRVRGNIRITRTVTGRPSMSRPNLLAQPTRTDDARKVRRGFVAMPGYKLVELDYNQIEMRVTAHCSGDPEMVGTFLRGEDVHAQTASRMFRLPIGKLDKMKHRYPAKRTGFGILNLITARGLLRELIAGGADGWNETGCQELINSWFEIYPGVLSWINGSKAMARRYGRIEDMWGRVRLVPEVISVHRSIVEAGLRQAVNAPIQMGAAGVIKRAMIKLWQEIVMITRGVGLDKCKCKPLLQIYDSLLFEIVEEMVEELAAKFKEGMEQVVRMDVPIVAKVEVGDNWGQMSRMAL